MRVINMNSNKILGHSLSSTIFCSKLKHKSIVLKHLFNLECIVYFDRPFSINVLERT